ncbi:MAG: molybdopterin-dependent oxidoreductase [Spirochaetia bacterium]|nr:molybdopterin-dependent oxidoreductase [Spirochaetia bacterium]
MSKPHYKPSVIEKIAEALHIIPNLHGKGKNDQPGYKTDLSKFPPIEKWNDWEEFDPSVWPRKEKKKYSLIPTNCFNCESGCGLVAYIDKETNEVRKFEGNPFHPGSRGRNCAKGPATINQIHDPDRILYPLKRKGERGSGQWERVSWEDAMNDIASRIGKAIKEGRNNEVAYHVGRPGHEGYMERVLNAWGVDGHNSHTNICSAGSRFGYALWHGFDRPSPDHANAKFILLISAHLESGHYFNPHAQRIMEAMMNGSKLAVIDPRLSNTASMADYWVPAYPGTEAAMLLAMAKIILDEKLFDPEYMQNWVNWQEYMAAEEPKQECTFENFIESLQKKYSEYTPEFAAKECGVDAEMIVKIAHEIGRAGKAFSAHVWRAASMGNEGGWAVARALHFLSVLTGSVGTVGGTSPSGWQKVKPKLFDNPPAHKFWNELHFPKEYPFSHFEMSFILPHMIKDGRGKLDVYFTRVFNPVWTYPDGFTWMDVLEDESRVGLHVALTPTWNETAYYADYVLPMGHSSERHDWISYETHAGKWVGFRQPVLREAARRAGKKVEFTYEVNPGEVWEEDEFWIELSWKIDPDGSMGIRKHFLSPYRKDQKINIDEYYQYAFENLPGLPEKAKAENLTPLDYMRKYGVFEVEKKTYNKHLARVDATGAEINSKNGLAKKDGKTIGVLVNGEVVEGFPTPSRKQELYSQTMSDWKWPEYTLPVYIKSHIHSDKINSTKNEFTLLPTFRLPNLIHSRSGNAQWLVELAHKNPVWIHTSDAERLDIKMGDLIRVNTEIGFFVNRVWVTEGIRPGVVACSHHIGRWRKLDDPNGNRWASNLVNVSKEGPDNNIWKMRILDGVRPFHSSHPDSKRIYWSDGGVHQDITHAVHPDPISGAHCWHQKVMLEKAHNGDRYGDVSVDTNKSMQVYRDWLKKTRPAPGPGGLRRPLWMGRPLKPADDLFYIKDK